MMSSLPPGTLLMLGALLVPFLRGLPLRAWILVVPVVSFLHLMVLPLGTHSELQLFGMTLTPVRIDALSRVWGIVFHFAAFLSALYALHVKDKVQHTAGLAYAGAGIAAAFAGDPVTLFVWWELTAITSVFLIWASRTEHAFKVGMRYLIIQVGSGVLLLSGVIWHYQVTGDLFFGYLGDSPAFWLFFFAFGIKAAFPFMHNWLQDAYPAATATGTVFLSAFTTKLAIYALARGMPGVDLLIPIGAVMTAFPIFFAVLENDLRKVLAYSLNNQLGFMVVGIGIGTEMSLDGTAAHAFAHILYKALLFMSMGAVLHRVGTTKASELGGLYKSMPWTTLFCIIGAVSISGVPLFSGFVTKSMIVSEAGHGHHLAVYLTLLFASAGVIHHSGIKIPFFAFFAHDSGIRVKEAPMNMLLAMGITAALCVGIGVYPAPLYAILPHGGGHYEPYTVPHVINMLQLLAGAVLAFALLERYHLHPPEQRSTILDFDWVYRRMLPAVVRRAYAGAHSVRLAADGAVRRALSGGGRRVYGAAGPAGWLARTWQTGGEAGAVVLLLAFYLLLYLDLF